MIERLNGAVASLRPAARGTVAATATLVFDTVGHEYAVVRVHAGTNATNAAVFDTLKLTEHDTLTQVTSHTAIVSATGGTAISASVGFVIPTYTSLRYGGIVEFQVPLARRKRFLALHISSPQNIVYGATADLFRSKQSKDTAATRKLTNSGATSDASISTIVSVT